MWVEGLRLTSGEHACFSEAKEESGGEEAAVAFDEALTDLKRRSVVEESIGVGRAYCDKAECEHAGGYWMVGLDEWVWEAAADSKMNLRHTWGLSLLRRMLDGISKS